MQIFVSFLRLGATAFGGVSMVAYLRKTVVDQKGWLDYEEFGSGLALCQMIPGATTMQLAGYIGLRLHGLIGALVSFTAFGLPALCLMILLAALYVSGQDLPVVSSVFSGLQAIIVAIVGYAVITFGKTTLDGWRTFLIAGIAASLYGLSVNPILVIGIAAVTGLISFRMTGNENSTGRFQPISRRYIQSIVVLVALVTIGMLLLYFMDQDLFDLVFTMARISLFSFGGGYAAIPLMLHEVVEVHAWMDSQTFMNGIVLGQVTPGPVVITATYIGYILHGLSGSLLATTGIFLPSFVVLVAITPYFDRIKGSPYFISIIKGVLCSFVGLLLVVTIRFAVDVDWDFLHVILAVAAFVALLRKVDILWVVLAGTLLSALWHFL